MFEGPESLRSRILQTLGGSQASGVKRDGTHEDLGQLFVHSNLKRIQGLRGSDRSQS